MTEHSIEELERQLQSAQDRLQQAQKDVADARKRIDDARLNKTGLMGHVVEYEHRSLRAKTTKRRFVVEGIKYNGRYVSGTVIKADGKKGVREDYIALDRVTDLGPYVEPSP